MAEKIIIKVNDKIKFNRSFFINASVLFLFFSMNVYELTTGPIHSLFKKGTQVLIFTMAIVFCTKKINARIILMMSVCIITGFINYKYVGNTMISNQIIILIYILGSLLLTDSCLSEKIVRLAIYINIAVICYRFMVVGLFNRVYNTGSNNYISVYLLLPTVVYYTLLERKQLEPEIHTAVIVWIMCLFGMGRGGILCSSLFLAGLMYIRFVKSKISKKLFILSVLGIALISFIPFTNVIISHLSDAEMFSKFSKSGFESDGREEIWSNYLQQAFKTKLNFCFGGDNSHTIAAKQFNGNTHNTYLSIHVHNGIFPLILIAVLTVYNVITAIKNKAWIYCLCLFVIILRGYTDVIFWLNLGTPVLFYLIFYQFLDKKMSKNIQKLIDIIQKTYKLNT